jgi:hypothetical protein
LVVTKLVIGSFSPSVLLRVARRTGRLREQGLDVEEASVGSSPAQFLSLFDGGLDAALTSPDNVLAYRYVPDNPLGRTGDVKIVSAVDRGLGLALYGRPGQLPGQLPSGARLGVDVPTSGFAFAMYALLEWLGSARDEFEIVALGSTPKRLEALLAGRCDATMLNAGNELLAERAGCHAFARVTDLSSPYLGTVIAVVGIERVEPVRLLSVALKTTVRHICAGDLDDVVIEEAASALALPTALAGRYLQRLRDADEGLIPDSFVDPVSLATVINLRRRYQPSLIDGVDLLAPALISGSGLIATQAVDQPATAVPAAAACEE